MMRGTGGTAAILAVVGTILLPSMAARADDPPTRVGRIAFLEGTVSFHPSPEEAWGVAVLNYPVAASTALWAEEGARAELEIGAARIRLDGGTELDVTQLDDQTIHLSLPQGRIDVTLQGGRTDEHYEIETPRGTVTLADGRYRLTAGTQDVATTVAAFAGAAEIELDSQQTMVGPGLEATAGPTEPAVFALAPTGPDAFDDWSAQRDGRTRPPPAAAQAVPGTGALAEYGSWRTVPDYGAVWTPADVPAGWTPYSVGHWGWVPPWGWTWIDAEPWGFAPFHYGRWVELGSVWSWVPVEPGIVVEPGFVPVWAPALVSFVGTPYDLSVAFGGPAVAWIPLGPGEFWQPWFPVGFEYVRRANVINVNRTVINTVTLGNYRTTGAGQTLVNRQAAMAVPSSAFAAGRPVQAASLQVDRAALARTGPALAAPVLPKPAAGARLASPAARTISAAAPAVQPRGPERSGFGATARGATPPRPMPGQAAVPPPRAARPMPQGRAYGPQAAPPAPAGRAAPAAAPPRKEPTH